jgi:succinyl-CoA synthetase alpha subunit
MNMNNDEFERKMAFIVEQQAQFASDIQQLQESQARTEKVVAHTADSVAQTADTVAQMGDVVTRLANVTHVGFTEVNAKINALVDAQVRTEENLTRTDKNLDRTDENLRNLIAAVDRLLRDRRNGK